MTFLASLEKSVDRCYALFPRPKPVGALGSVKLIAHRGAHSKNPLVIENTLAAFDRAAALGCWGIELDVHLTADNIPVVHHDPDLLRLWGNPLHILDMNLQQLQKIAPQVPTLAEVVQRYGRKMHLFIELKVPILQIGSLLAALTPLSPEQDYHLLSLEKPIFAQLQDVPKSALLLVASHNNVSEFCKSSVQKSYGGVLGHYLLLTQAKTKLLRDAQQKTGVGFIDSKYSLYREINRGHSWIFTNNAACVAPILHKLQQNGERS